MANVEIKKAINKPNVQSDFKMKILSYKIKFPSNTETACNVPDTFIL